MNIYQNRRRYEWNEKASVYAKQNINFVCDLYNKINLPYTVRYERIK